MTAQVLPTTTRVKYAKFLPSANAIFKFPNNVQLRLGMARATMRPSLSKLHTSSDTKNLTVTSIFDVGAAALDDPTLNLQASGDAGKDAEIHQLKREPARVTRLAGSKAQIGYKRRPGSYDGKPSLAIDETLDRQFDVTAPDRAWMTEP